MSYTKLNKEIEKYLKANNLLWSGKSTDSKEVTAARLEAYKKGRDVIFKRWLEEKKYKELIACAHGGCFSQEDLFIPLAEYFTQEKLLEELKLLFERRLKSLVRSTLSVIWSAKDGCPNFKTVDVIASDLTAYDAEQHYNAVAEAAKWRNRSLNELDIYIRCLEQFPEDSYLMLIRGIRHDVASVVI